MNTVQREQLENEASIGRKANSSYVDFVGPFMEKKRQDLYNSFQIVSIENTDALTEVKRQLIVLNNLDQEIKNIIETGKLASQQLSQEPLSKH